MISLGFRAGKHQQRAKCLIVSKWSHLRNRLIRRKCPQSTCTVHNILHKYTQVHTSTHHPTQVPSKHLHSTHHSTTKEHYSTHHPTTIERAPSNALQGSDIVIQYRVIHSGHLPHWSKWAVDHCALDSRKNVSALISILQSGINGFRWQDKVDWSELWQVRTSFDHFMLQAHVMTCVGDSVWWQQR